MAPTLALLLDDTNARRAREERSVGLLLLERTLLEPPRAAACRRWAERLRRIFPNAELAAYAWQLVSHGPADGLRHLGTRSLPGEATRFGGLQNTPEVSKAMEIVRTVLEALGTDRLLVRTPPSLAPGAIGRSRLNAFFAGPAAGLRVTWEPQGLWEALDAQALAAAAAIDVMLPAFEGGRPVYADDARERLVGRNVWLRVDPAGPRRTLGGAQVDALVDHVAADPSSTLVFTGPRALANLRGVADALEADGLFSVDEG